MDKPDLPKGKNPLPDLCDFVVFNNYTVKKKDQGVYNSGNKAFEKQPSQWGPAIVK